MSRQEYLVKHYASSTRFQGEIIVIEDDPTLREAAKPDIRQFMLSRRHTTPIDQLRCQSLGCRIKIDRGLLNQGLEFEIAL